MYILPLKDNFNVYFVSQEIAKQQMFRHAQDILEITIADQRFLALKASYVRMRYVNRHRTGFWPTEQSNLDFEVNWQTLYCCFCSTCMCSCFHFLNISNISLSLCRLTWMSWAAPTSCQLSSGMMLPGILSSQRITSLDYLETLSDILMTHSR